MHVDSEDMNLMSALLGVHPSPALGELPPLPPPLRPCLSLTCLCPDEAHQLDVRLVQLRRVSLCGHHFLSVKAATQPPQPAVGSAVLTSPHKSMAQDHASVRRCAARMQSQPPLALTSSRRSNWPSRGFGRRRPPAEVSSSKLSLRHGPRPFPPLDAFDTPKLLPLWASPTLLRPCCCPLHASCSTGFAHWTPSPNC